MYFDFRTLGRVAVAILTDTPSPRRLVTHVVILSSLVVWAAFNSLCLLLDRVAFPQLTRRKVVAPVFIVGNARSGTTFFHRILCGDTERFAHFRMWEILLPSLLQKRAVRGLAGLLERLGSGVGGHLRRWEDRKFKELRKMHPIGLSAPEEDEFLMLIPFASPVLNVLFPYPQQLSYLTHFDAWPEEARRRSMRYYVGCVQRQLCLHPDGVTLVSKNPAFVSKLRSLRETFPDARFIYMVRNPFETLPSLLNMLREVWLQLGVGEAAIQRAMHEIGEGCIQNYLYAMEVLREWPDESYAVVRYEDLITAPRAAVEAAYLKLGLPISQEFAGLLEEEQSRAKGYRSEHRYSLEDVGLDRAEVEARLRPVLERFGWGTSSPSMELTTAPRVG